MDTEITENELKPLLQGLLFTSGEEGLSLLQIQSVLSQFDRSTLLRHLELLRRDCQEPSSGIELVHYGGRWKLVAKESIAPYARRLFSKTRSASLSNAAMEVLSLIAYRQPVTRVEIDEIRGVSSELMLKKLQARDLIETCGHKDAVGRPLLYQVSRGFYDAFGLESLADLPACDIEALPDDLFDALPDEAASKTVPASEPEQTGAPKPSPAAQTAEAKEEAESGFTEQENGILPQKREY